MKTHKDLLSLSEEEVKEELRLRHAVQVEREAKRQEVVDAAEKLGVSVPDEIKDVIVENEDLHSQLVKNNDIYLERVRLGKQISDILDEGIVREASLMKEHRIALDIYRRQEPRCDVMTVQLRPWQEDAMKLFESPTERQVIWVAGR